MEKDPIDRKITAVYEILLLPKGGQIGGEMHLALHALLRDDGHADDTAGRSIATHGQRQTVENKLFALFLVHS